jgi:hypothetical protein
VSKRLLLLQFLLTLFILGFIESNAVKVCLLLPLWWVSFGGLSKAEWIVFVIINVVFVISDLGAIRNGVFQFTYPDVLGLPYYELFMWGFYFLHTHRMLQTKYPPSVDAKVLVLAGIFSVFFGILSDPLWLLICTSGILLLTLVFYHDTEDLLFTFYMMCMGAAVEWVGLNRGLWIYPARDPLLASAQFVVMWGGSGLFLRRIVGPWLISRRRQLMIDQSRHFPLGAEVQPLWLEARSLRTQGHQPEAWGLYEKIQARSGETLLPLNYEFCVEASDLATSLGYFRKAIELNRAAFQFVTNPLERANVFLSLCRLYRMMILMANARFELKHAFRELRMHYPSSTVGALLRSLVQFTTSYVRPGAAPSTDDERTILETQIALYEEAGLSAYYYREYLSLIQCTLRPRALVYRLGPSIQMINWLGGTGCVLSLLGIGKAADSMIGKAEQISRTLPPGYPGAKALLWRALAQDYLGEPTLSAKSFSKLLTEFRCDLSPHDLRLASATLACNYLLRGQMQESNRVIESMFDEISSSQATVFSNSQTFVDWYRIPALSFLGRDTELQDIIKNSKVIFSSTDEEKWQVTQFLGGLLIYYYTQEDKPMDEIDNCLRRFDSLGLTPRSTYSEACHYWVARAYVLLELFREGKVEESRALQALSDLERTRRHPSVLAHFYLLRAKWKWNTNDKSRIQENLTQALNLAERHENDWVKFEAYALQSRERAIDLATKKGWKNRTRWLERGAAWGR